MWGPGAAWGLLAPVPGGPPGVPGLPPGLAGGLGAAGVAVAKQSEEVLL